MLRMPWRQDIEHKMQEGQRSTSNARHEATNKSQVLICKSASSMRPLQRQATRARPCWFQGSM